MTEPEHHRRRRTSRDARGWRYDRARPVIILAGVAVIVLAAAGVAFLLGGGPGIAGGASPSPSTSPTLPSSPAAGVGSPGAGSTSTAPTSAPGSLAPGISPSPPTVNGEPGIQANHITIARLGIDLAVVQGDGIDAPIGKAAHYPSSGWPGGGTNIYIYGHARVGMFIRLWDIKVGDTVVLGLVDGTTRSYVVTKILPTVPGTPSSTWSPRRPSS